MKIKWPIGWLLAAVACNDAPPADTKVPAAESNETILKKSIAQYPDSLPLRDSLIVYYKNTDNIEAALATVNAVLAKDSSLAHFWDQKGMLHGMQDDTANAILAWEKAMAIDPQPELAISLGTLYAYAKNEKALLIGNALLLADKAVANDKAFLLMGIYYSKTGNKQKAIQLFDQALQIDYRFTFAYMEKAKALYDLAKYADALGVLEKATALNNSLDEGYYWMGRCSEKLGKLEEAANYYQMALEFSGDYVEARDALARLGVK
jgi:tetratricopeptide (TPR) repeat protein